MKTLTLLSICALLSVSCSMGGFEPDVVVDLADDTAVDSDAADLADADLADRADLDDLDDQADPDDPDATPASPASDSSSDSSASDSNSSSDSTSSSESSESSSSESNSASDSSSSSSSSSSESVSEEVPTEPEPEPEPEPEVIMKRDLAAVLLRRRRAAPAGDLSPLQLESLREVCELNDGCDEMAETAGIVAAYVAYYGAVPF